MFTFQTRGYAISPLLTSEEVIALRLHVNCVLENVLRGSDFVVSFSLSLALPWVYNLTLNPRLQALLAHHSPCVASLPRLLIATLVCKPPNQHASWSLFVGRVSLGRYIHTEIAPRISP